MGYFIKRLPFRKSSPKWKVQFVSYKKMDIKPECRAKKPRREWNIPKARWQALGFNTFMTLEEARSRAKQLNDQQHLKRQEVVVVTDHDQIDDRSRGNLRPLPKSNRHGLLS